MREKHGRDFDAWFARTWQQQDGRCYLCDRELSGSRIHVDHDHSCCPPRKSCALCRRGLACHQCNIAIGMAREDPDILRRMADRLEAAKAAAKARIAAKPIQETLDASR